MIESVWRRAVEVLRAFARAQQGGIALWTAVCLPPLAVISIGAVELVSVSADQAKMQEAADSAALAAARELGFSGPGGVIERAQANALAPLAAVAERTTLTATAALNTDTRTVSVVITGNRMSFFGNLLPPGGFNTRAESSATALGSAALCMVGMRSGANDVIHLTGSSSIQSPGCLIQSNSDLKADNSARVVAAEVQVAGVGQGSITPAALQGAPTLSDPYASRTITFPSLCNIGEILDLSQILTATLQPGMHCGKIKVPRNGSLTLAPGVHYFRDATIELADNARLTGNGVTLIFDNKSTMKIKDTSSLDLLGSRSGVWAGFLIVGPRSAGPDFEFDSSNIDRLEGVIYLPNNKLKISASAQVAEGSNWTVTLAREITIERETTLVMNVNYAASDVPVPVGVGPSPSGTRLRR